MSMRAQRVTVCAAALVLTAGGLVAGKLTTDGQPTAPAPAQSPSPSPTARALTPADSPHGCVQPLCVVVTPSFSPRASRTREPARRPARAASRSRGAGLNWAALKQCENGGSYRSRPGDHFRGAYQFDRETWASVGGSGDPAAASPAEQDRRALLLYSRRGRAPWPVCGKLL